MTLLLLFAGLALKSWPAPQPIIHPPQRLPDGTVLFSGSGPVGAVVSIYVTTDVQTS